MRCYRCKHWTGYCRYYGELSLLERIIVTVRCPSFEKDDDFYRNVTLGGVT